MSNHHGMPVSETGSISASLSALVDLFEFFSDTLRDLRGQRIATIRQPWREYFGKEAPSLDEVLNETALAVLECQLKLMTLLTETRLEELIPHVDGPFTVSDEVSRYRKRAEEKLLELYDRVSIAKSLLGKEEQDDTEDAVLLQSQRAMNLDLMLEREEMPDEVVHEDSDDTFEVSGNEEDLKELIGTADQLSKSDEWKEPFEVDNQTTGDMNLSTSDNKEAILENKELAEALKGKNDPEDDFWEDEPTPEIDFPIVVEEIEPEELQEQLMGDEGTKKNMRPVERNRAGLKLVSSDPMVGAGRYDDFDSPENGDRRKQEPEATQQISDSKESEGETVAEQVPEVQSTAATEQSDKQSTADVSGVKLHPDTSTPKGKIDAFTQSIAPLKRVHRDASDLKVKTSGGTWTLSLPYYHGQNVSGQSISLLDLENFIGIHNLAFRGVLDAATKQDMDDSDPRLLKLVQKLHAYFRRLYANISVAIAPHGSRILPDIGDSLEPDIFLLLEADLVLIDWKSSDDVRAFRDMFKNKIAKPFNEYISDSDNKLAYLQSIAELSESGDDISSQSEG